MKFAQILIASATLLLTINHSNANEWPEKFVDPGAQKYGPADLILPLPCGGGMAFQRIDVPVDIADPLDDRMVRLGGSDPEKGFVEYLRRAPLRGAFSDETRSVSYYYIARYEVTVAQYDAISGNCAAPSMRSLIPKLQLSWFDALIISRDYSEWLFENGGADFPAKDGARAYLRPPTEVEWEYAVRGGVKVPKTDFDSRRFFKDGSVAEFGWHQGSKSSSGQPRPVGFRKPNPLGLFDVYGNAEELMLEPFHMNALGRNHGQIGALITRGGSFLSGPEQIYSAHRREWPLFARTDGRALGTETFGLRMVLTAHVASSDKLMEEAQRSWIKRSTSDSNEDGPPNVIDEIASAIEAETDHERVAQLAELQQLILTEKDRVQEANETAAKASMLAGSVVLTAVRRDHRAIAKGQNLLIKLQNALKKAPSEAEEKRMRRLIERAIGGLDRRESRKSNNLDSYALLIPAILETTDSLQRRRAFDKLSFELRASQRTAMLEDLGDFYRDILQYEITPDMSRNDLLEMLLDN